MTLPPSSPPALSSGALADEVREQLAIHCSSITIHDLNHTTLCGNCYACSAIASLAQLVARLEQAEQEADSLRTALEVPRRYDVLVSEWKDRFVAASAQRDDALAALRYIKQQYGPLDGVGWNRLTGDET